MSDCRVITKADRIRSSDDPTSHDRMSENENHKRRYVRNGDEDIRNVSTYGFKDRKDPFMNKC